MKCADESEIAPSALGKDGTETDTVAHLRQDRPLGLQRAPGTKEIAKPDLTAIEGASHRAHRGDLRQGGRHDRR